MEDTKVPPLLTEYFNQSNFTELLKTVIDKKPDELKNIIKSMERMVKNNSKKLTYNQLRNIYDIVKKDEYKVNIADFIFTLPMLAYIEARQEGVGKDIVNFIRELATAVNTTKEYEAFIELMTALVAYHKLHAKS